ncbi:MAG TPA: class I SAM-dependent methyltransferase [Solirubrobacterales bacterium]|nr:class I SAM-dependent methyltransferase [Solirubrobacterales bacterium]
MSNPLFARFFDRFVARDKGRGEDQLRRELLAGLSGEVLEVGPGNGINFEHYPAAVARLLAVEPEPYLRERAGEAARSAPVPVTVLDGSAAALPLASGSVDAVVVAGVLCSVPDQKDAGDDHRVDRPGGELRFYEHVRSRRPAFARYQAAVDLLWPRLMGGCRTSRDTLAAIERGGFRLERVRGFGFPSDARAYPVAPRILGAARVGE